MKTNRILAGTLALVLVAGLGTPAFAQFYTGTATQGLAGSTSVTTPQQNLGCNLITFEGIPETNLIGTIGAATFSADVGALIDADAPGGSGSFANEPSPDTVALDFGFTGPGPTTVTFSSPVEKVSFFYSGLVAGSVDFLDAGGVVLATVPMPVTPDGPGVVTEVEPASP